jgi:hypothetical protein
MFELAHTFGLNWYFPQKSGDGSIYFTHIQHPGVLLNQGPIHSAICSGVTDLYDSKGAPVYFLQTKQEFGADPNDLVKQLRERYPDGVCLAGIAKYADVKSGFMRGSIRRGMLEWEVDIFCITPAYRKKKTGRAFWIALEKHLIRLTFTENGKFCPYLATICDAIVFMKINIKAIIKSHEVHVPLEKLSDDERKQPSHVREELIRSNTVKYLDDNEVKGAWLFWQSVGFQPDYLSQGSLVMSKEMEDNTLYERLVVSKSNKYLY